MIISINQKGSALRIYFIHIVLIFQLFVILTFSNAQDNYDAGCAIDLNVNTDNFDMDISNQDIDTIIVNSNNNIIVGIIAQNVLNIKAFQLNINYPTHKLNFINGY